MASKVEESTLEILSACPTHGAGTIQAHSSLCNNQEHRILANAMLLDFKESDDSECKHKDHHGFCKKDAQRGIM